MEAALQASENRYKMVGETMNQGLGGQDERGTINLVNRPFAEMMGYEEHEIRA